ncbi:ParA family protein [bacterium]|nr:ParA family protein [bacterium]
MARRVSRDFNSARIIAIGNPKGGVGKTATTISVARIIKDHQAFMGKRILLIDTDPLGIMTKMIISRRTKVLDDQTLLPVLQKNRPISEVIQRDAWSDLKSGVVIDYICSHRPISRLEGLERFDLYRLKHALDEVKNDYYKIMIDCPANSSNLYFSACVASDLIIFPFGSIESLSGLEVTSLELCRVDEKIVDNIKILFTMQDVNSELTASLINTARQYLDFPQFETIIRRCPHFSLEIADSQTTGTYHVPDSIAINDYLFFVEELFATDFKKEFVNKQRFSFGHSKIDERLWSAFYETSFLITNEREKSRGGKYKSALQEVHQLERELKESGATTSKKSKDKQASKKILVETCSSGCPNPKHVLGSSDFFYLAELLPGEYRKLQKEGQHRYLYLYHGDCYETLFTRLFLQQEYYRDTTLTPVQIVAQEVSERDKAYNRTFRKKMHNTFLTFIRDPKRTNDISYLVHFWGLLRDREFLTRWNLPAGGELSVVFGGLSSYLDQGQTIVITGIADPERQLSRKNLTHKTDYYNFQNFKTFLEEKLKRLTT